MLTGVKLEFYMNHTQHIFPAIFVCPVVPAFNNMHLN